MNSHSILVALACGLLTLGGCGGEGDSGEKSAGTQEARPLTVEEATQNPRLLEKRLRASNPYYQGGAQLMVDPEIGLVGEITVKTVRDLSGLRGIPFAALDLRGLPIADFEPLRGMPLKHLGLEQTRIRTLAPLEGMPLEKLYLNDTAVADLTPLKGMPLKELMLVRTQVKDLEPLRGAPLEMLWLNETPVTEIGPIADCPLISLTLEGTRVADLSTLAGHKTLQRLHIAGTPIADLTPIREMQLVRLIFTPGSVTSGIEIVRGMISLQEIGTTLDGCMSPAQFWELYDQRGQR
jgi:antitoxin (DNA-binding transcriptional repressor) of toxin-antitoxin stability system